MHNRLIGFVSAFALLFTSVSIPAASAAPLSDCRIATAPYQIVSLGFPILPERLKDKAKPKILVLPYRLSDRPTYSFGDDAKADYLAATAQIERFSGGKSKPEMVFANVVDIPDTVADMVTLRQFQQNAYNQDESKSTWGFVRRVIALGDPKIDFTGIDGVILHGSSTSSDSWIAEAMMFQSNPTREWFRPVITNEGPILNAVLLDKRTTISTITHEIMHLYGLTDLYGTQTGPAELSLMASNADSLLSYEKWILGWVPDSQVQCLNEATEIDKSKLSTRITLPNNTNEALLVINTGRAGTAYVIETLTKGVTKFLTFYSLDNEMRPPITLHPSVLGRPNEGIGISNLAGVGVQLNAPNYTLLVTDMTPTEITLDLIPKEQLSNAAQLINTAAQNRARIQAAAQAANKPTVTKPKQKTIICVQGKKTKKVVAVKPKCPAGFSKKK
jgi:hypothetical protein